MKVLLSTFHLNGHRLVRILSKTLKVAWENTRYSTTPPLVSARGDAKWPLRNERRNSMLMTRHSPDLWSASDRSCREGNLLQPIRSIKEIWVVTRHQYGIFALVPQTLFWLENQLWRLEMSAVLTIIYTFTIIYSSLRVLTANWSPPFVLNFQIELENMRLTR